jgi:hypothetical protein
MGKTQMKIMNFVDGPKEITEGMQVVVTNGDSGSHFRFSETKVEKVGRDLVTLDNRLKFYLETGLQQTDYAKGKIYSSLAAYQEITNQRKLIRHVELHLRNRKLTFEEAQKLMELLNIPSAS